MERPDTNAELGVYLTELNAKLAQAIHRDYCRSCSDDFYHSNGGFAASQREITWIRSEIKETERILALSN